MKKRTKSLISSVLCVALGMSGINIAPLMSMADEADDMPPNPLVAMVEKVKRGASMNLTEEGTLDWVHITGEEINRKANVNQVIELENLNPDSPISTASDSAMAYSWEDGTPIQSQTNSTTAGVFNYKAGEFVGAVTEDAGYRITVPESQETRMLTFVSGIWEATATIEIVANDSHTPVYTTQLSADDSAQTNKYTIAIRPGNSVTVTTKLTEKTHEWGNLSLGGIALRTEEFTPITVEVQDPSAMPSLDLTQRGDVDWMHFEGGNRIVQKAGVDAQISYRSLSDSEITTMGDAPVKYSWSDGTPVESATDITTGAVFTYRNGDEGSVGIPIAEPAGYELSIAPAAFERELVVVSGVWNADAEISIVLEGDDTPVYENKDLTAENTVVNKIYTVSIPADKGVTVTGTIKEKHHSGGNFNLQAAVLSSQQTLQNYKRKLQEQLDVVKELNLSDYDMFYANQLESEIRNAEALLNEQATNEAYYTALLFLNHAYESCLHSESGSYTYESNRGLTASFGWEGDVHAPIAYIDGSYRLRDNGDTMITFGVKDIPGDIKWYNAEGYLPCLVSEYSMNGMEYRIESFSNKHTIDGNDYEIAYSRMTVKNTTEQRQYLPRVSSQLIPLNDETRNVRTVAAGETMVREYAIGADRFGGSYDYPEDEVIAQQGSFDDNYTAMKTYWDNRLASLTELDLPDEQLVNAYKAGFIYTMIIRDDINGDKELRVGENGYDRLFDHDTIGIVASLLTEGDFLYAKEYLATLPAQLEYDDAKWKYSWPYALYLSKTGDHEFIQEKFEVIKGHTHSVETDRINGGEGIIKKTFAIDSNGSWLIDNWAALAGLSTYQYLCEELYEEYNDEQYKEESDWAQAEYDSLLRVVEQTQKELRETYDYPYLSIDMYVPTEQSARGDARDANWASMFLFGRWGWDGYLFGAEQEGSEMIALIDDTYTHGFERRAEISDTIYNFGGYPHGYYSSAYNAGYGSTALRGEEYRDAGIKAYQFMIEYAMSGPFSWWEGVDYPNENSPWDIDHAAGGGGSCQHMWGQSTASKVLIDSLIAEKVNEKIIIGRGIPSEWIVAGETVSVANHVVEQGKRIGYTISTAADGKTVTIQFTGDATQLPLSIEFIKFKNNIAEVSTGTVDREAGIVTVPGGTKEVTVTLGEMHEHNAVHVDFKAATCTEKGNMEYWYCEECGKYFSNAEATTEITKEDTELDLIPHTEETIPSKEATCTEDGLTEGVKCSVCGEILKAQETIKATGHHFENGVCIDCGAEDPNATLVDKSLLQKTYDYAKAQDTSNLVSSAKEKFDVVMAKAEAVLQDKNATQEQVNATWNELVDVIHALGLVKGEKDMLELVIAQADAMMAEADKYVEANWQQLVDALDAAKAVMDDGDAMQGEVDEATGALLDAILAQRFKANKDILDDLIGKAENVDLSGYTAESVAVFRSALAEAQAIMADESLSEDDQKTVDAAVEQLTAAMDGLTAEGETQPSDKPETTNQPEVTDEPQGSKQPEATQNPENVPQTGDNASLGLFTTLAVASAGACAGLTLLRRKQRS